MSFEYMYYLFYKLHINFGTFTGLGENETHIVVADIDGEYLHVFMLHHLLKSSSPNPM